MFSVHIPSQMSKIKSLSQFSEDLRFRLQENSWSDLNVSTPSSSDQDSGPSPPSRPPNFLMSHCCIPAVSREFSSLRSLRSSRSLQRASSSNRWLSSPVEEDESASPISSMSEESSVLQQKTSRVVFRSLRWKELMLSLSVYSIDHHPVEETHIPPHKKNIKSFLDFLLRVIAADGGVGILGISKLG